MASNHIKIKLREVNRHLVCRLCRGYYVDATTIAECLHSFCRSCIIKYLEKNSFCPICEVQIHKTKPYLNLRLDKALQDVVYKVVPGLYHDEMKRRRDFYAKCQEQIPLATPEQCGLEERIIFSPEDSISLSLEYLESDDFESETVSSQSSESGDNPDILSFPQQLGLIKLKSNDGKTSRRESQDVQETSFFLKRYLQCPAVVNVGHLKKFIRMKHELTDKMQVSIIHKRVPLPDHYTLMDVAYIFTWKRSAPLRFFYQIYQAKKHKLKIPPRVSETEKFKSQSVTQELKSVKNVTEDKICCSDVVKTSSEADQIVKINSDKNETVVSELNQTVHNNVLKNVDSNTQMAETKSDLTVKRESNVNGVTQEAKDGFETESEITAAPRNNKFEKPKLSDVNITENKNKVEGQKRKSVKIENNVCGARDVKENEFKNSERLLLNPISGQLESVSSNDQCKSNMNGEVSADEKKEIGENLKKEITNKIPRKAELQNAKDSKKSNVSLLKSFRKEKLKTGKDEKVEIRNNRGSSLTITAVSKNEKFPEKEAANFHVEIKSDNKESEYDFDGSSPPSKIIPLQEFSKYSKYSKYMAEHRDKWLSKESKNNWMSLQDFRDKMLKESDANEEDAFKKNRKKVLPSLYKINLGENKISAKKILNGKLSHEKSKGQEKPTIINIKTDNHYLKKAEVKLEVMKHKISSPLQPVKIENKDGEFSVKHTNEKKSSSEKVRDAKPSGEKVRDAKPSGEKVREAKPNAEKVREAKPNAEKVRDAKSNSEKMGDTKSNAEKIRDIKSGAEKVRDAKSNSEKIRDTKSNAEKIRDIKSGAEKVWDSKSSFQSTQHVQQTENKTNNGSSPNSLTESFKRNSWEKAESENLKNNTTNAEKIKNEATEAIDLSRAETTPKSGKNPLKNLMDMANKTPPKSPPKSEEKMVEALLSAAQNQSLEPLLKIPQYSQMMKNSNSQSSLSPGKNISPNEITQALQLLEELKSDIKVLEAKNQLNPNSVLEQFAQKSGNFEPYQQLYQQKIDLIRRLKRHQQIMPGDSDIPQRKHLKLSPTSESKRKLSPSPEQKAKTSPVSDEIAQCKSSLDRTLSQIQLMELQSRMIAAHNYKNLQALLQYYSRPPIFCPGPTSPSKSNQQKIKPSSHSPNKSPQSLSSSSGNSPLPAASSDSSFFNAQSYNHLINAGLNSEMTYHQMFQSYLNQQEQMNQVKLSQPSKKPVKFSEVSPKSISDKYYSPQTTAKTQEHNTVPSVQKS